MRKLLLLMSCVALIAGMAACSNTPASNNESELSASSNTQSTEGSSVSESSIDEKTSEAANFSEKTFEEMQQLFVMDGNRSDEVIVESNFTYTISGKTFDEIVAFMEAGIAEIGAVEDTKIIAGETFRYTGDYSNAEESIAITVTFSGESATIVVTY